MQNSPTTSVKKEANSVQPSTANSPLPGSATVPPRVVNSALPPPTPVTQTVPRPPLPPPSLVPFKWHTIDEQRFPTISLPVLLRQEEGHHLTKYLSVRLIETTILSKFEHLNSDEIRAHGNLMSVSCETAEVSTLNDINENHVSLGITFNEKDTLVKLEDFLKFYEILSRTCPIKKQQPAMTTTQQAHLSRQYPATKPQGTNAVVTSGTTVSAATVSHLNSMSGRQQSQQS